MTFGKKINGAKFGGPRGDDADGRAWSDKMESAIEDDNSLVKKYFRETSLHGMKYIVEQNRHLLERLFWISSGIVSWCLAIYLICQVFHKWEKSPILVSFASVQTPIWDIPFPTLTVCNMNKVRKSKVEYIKEQLQNDPSSTEYLTEARFAQEICSEHIRFDNGSEHESAAASHDHDDDDLDLDLTADDLHRYLKELGQSCDDLLLRCHFEGHDYNCSTIFTATITDEGQCCSFNIMPEYIMLRDPYDDVDETEALLWKNWTLQDGYRNDPVPHDENFDKTTLLTEERPWRALAPGLHMGLTVVLDVHEDDYYCSASESIGFKVLLHTPISIPEMTEFGFAIQPGTENFVAVAPSFMQADENIHGISYQKRQCYLDEKELEFFTNYSFLNCYMECVTNYTFQQCHCVAYYMPRHASTMPICAPEKAACVDAAVIAAEENAFAGNHISTISCNCLPGCTDIAFHHENSVSRLSRSDLLQLPPELVEAHPERYLNDTYVSRNVAVLNVFFNELHFMTHNRQRLYTTVDFFSSIGGLLGLCLGLSALSILEVIYFFSVRVFFNRSMGRKEK